MTKIDGKIFLITGGTGSFGKELTKLLLTTNISQIKIFSRDEKKQSDMRLQFPDSRLKFIIGDIRDYDSIFDAMTNVDYVFHAAALKQVPSCEIFPMEAVRTNIFGAYNVAKAAREHSISKCIFLSTDKAVYPINAMGQSKALMEKVLSSFAVDIKDSKTIFCATRYGNVMNSRGSVIPLFINQISTNRPMTITNPDMTRFLMSLNQAVELVLEALNSAESGDIYVLKSPACTIGDLAHGLMLHFNYKINPVIIGTRMGEKLYETLVSAEELTRAYETDKHFVIKANHDELAYEKFLYYGKLKTILKEDYTSHNTRRLNQTEIIDTLRKAEIIN